ncbi:SIS domain-containing protein [Sporohalobacter salinus]|uniref:SIS domain-containing protein n=1 Tax=Sporohalobacter salinus TaxID=1494606 RepID=UPI00195F920F|nr:SIS domain-containing protein [Sporohalobacter salinus]MBM7624939.1 glucosamine 6-phosphate synthetase-like amidotransferase/phosphosugar isomerase protein [Sporohalobacter salinus]
MNMYRYIKETQSYLETMITEKTNLYFPLAKKYKEKNIEKVVLSGSGSSYNAALACKNFLQKILNADIEVIYPFAINEYTFHVKRNTLFIGISQSGESMSTYNAMKIAKNKKCIIASMSGNKNCLINEISDYQITIRCGKENCGPKTKGYQCTVLNIILLGLEIALKNKYIDNTTFNSYINNISKSIKKLDNIITRSKKWVKRNENDFINMNDIKIISTNNNYAIALEGALKLLETLRCPVTGYELEEFIHGIYNAVNEKSNIFILHTTNKTNKIQKLKEILKQWTNKIFIIGCNIKENYRNLKLNFSKKNDFTYFEYIIPLQILSALIPPKKGINPSIPKDPQFHKKMESKRKI